MSKRKSPGRPSGCRPELNPPVVQVQPASICPRCGSPNRSDYWGKHVQAFAGVLPDGSAYGRIVRRRCRCLACGQIRIDKEYVRAD
jgi:hypothetical protein